jgi:addiction module RelE/StbE family toxin
MTPSYRIRITPRALADLEEIFERIRRDSPQNAARVIVRILDAIDSLVILPFRYSVPRGGGKIAQNVRSMPVRPYLIRYRVDGPRETIYVLHVRHGSRRQA